jgi:hypothetical protein
MDAVAGNYPQPPSRLRPSRGFAQQPEKTEEIVVGDADLGSHKSFARLVVSVREPILHRIRHGRYFTFCPAPMISAVVSSTGAQGKAVPFKNRSLYSLLAPNGATGTMPFQSYLERGVVTRGGGCLLDRLLPAPGDNNRQNNDREYPRYEPNYCYCIHFFLLTVSCFLLQLWVHG